MGRDKDISPAEAYRKKMRKKEIERNKKQRDARREVEKLRFADKDTVHTELARLQTLSKQGLLDNAHRNMVGRVEDIYQQKVAASKSAPALKTTTTNSAAAPVLQKPASYLQQSFYGGTKRPFCDGQQNRYNPEFSKQRRMEFPVAAPYVPVPAAPPRVEEVEVVLGGGNMMPRCLRFKKDPPKKPDTVVSEQKKCAGKRHNR